MVSYNTQNQSFSLSNVVIQQNHLIVFLSALLKTEIVLMNLLFCSLDFSFRPGLGGYCIEFIHFYSASHNMSLSEVFPTTSLCRSLHADSLQATARSLRIPLERDSNPRPSGRKASTLPMRHHAPQSSDSD